LPNNAEEGFMRLALNRVAGRLRSLPNGRIALAAIALLAGCHDEATSPGADSMEVPASLAVQPTTIPNQYIVVFKNEVTDAPGLARKLAADAGATIGHSYSHALKGFSAHLSEQAAAAIARQPAVAYVEADQEFTLAGTQTGPAWGLDRIDQASLPLDGFFNYPTTGSGVNVYILDSGIRRTHVEFSGRVVPAFSAIADGYGADGCHWHGTHVAGVVGGVTYGVAKGATLHSVRAYDCSGIGTTSSIVAAVDWITSNRVLPAVANLSISGPASAAVNTAVGNSINAGITYVVAAGNNAGASACGYSPASVPGAITVAAIGGMDAQATYSNVGSCVDLYAPGTQIYGPVNTDDNAIQLNSGTSQASAFVAGAAALYLQANPGATPAQVAEAIVSNATTGVVTGVTGGTPNRLLRVIGGAGSPLPPPPPPPPPANAPPVASFTASCSKASCSFNGSGSTDDSGISSYSWNFGDGATATGTSPLSSHVYAAKGNYSVNVTLTVTDNAGLTSSVQKSIAIRNKGGR
jgi:subtilisin family serine protease